MKIDFEFNTEYGTFRDSLCFEDDTVPSEQEIESMKQERLSNWIDLVKPRPFGPTGEPPVDLLLGPDLQPAEE